MLNPYARIRELEAQVERAETERLQACDELRRVQAMLDIAVQSERDARRDFKEHAERVEDWMAALMRQPGIHSRVPAVPAAMPKPSSSPRMQGAEMERKQLDKLEEQFLANCN